MPISTDPPREEKPVAAYFVGGPEDMTKRIMKNFMPTIRVPEIQQVPAYVGSDEEIGPVEQTIHIYRARCELHPFGQPLDYIVYEYQGRE